MKTLLILASLAIAFGCVTVAHAVTFDWAQIGNAGNAADTHGAGYGAVAYNYAISKTEVTNAQYTEFLNAVAATDTYGLYNTDMREPALPAVVRLAATLTPSKPTPQTQGPAAPITTTLTSRSFTSLGTIRFAL